MRKISQQTPRIWIALFLCLTLGPAFSSPVNFSLKDTQGKTHQLSDYRGRWVVINFWAAWCPPCLKEIPELVAFQRRFPKIQVLGINFQQQDPIALRPLLRRLKVNYPQLLINDMPMTPFEPLKGLPTTAIVDPQGRLVSQHSGQVTGDILEQFFRREGVIGSKAKKSSH
jgi:thiol-disulfide isomerase/thioredoxin